MYAFIGLSACLTVETANAQDWKWLNPKPSGNYLNCVKFANANIGYVVGKYGTILKTTNGGLNWNIQISGTTRDLCSISVIDKDTIYVCGVDLAIYKTVNGGNSWVRIFTQPNTSSNTNFIFFVNPAVGWAAGDGEELFKTTDYGKTWLYIGGSLTFQEETSIFFTTVDTGYASIGNGLAGEVLKTTDGGVSWTGITIPLTECCSSVIFTDNKTGYLIGYLGSIMKTTDAGNSWIIQNESSTNLTMNDLTSVCFIDNNTGFIVGGGDILKTTNGGNNWTVISQANYSLSSVYFTDTLHGCAVGGIDMYPASGIIKTSDGGNNWNQESSSFTSTYLNSIKFINSNVAYIVCGNTGTYSGMILKSTDSGNSWSQLDSGVNICNINNFTIVDTNTIYVVTDCGKIIKSANAGNSWTVQNTQTSNNLNSLCFPDPIIGYAVGSSGTIIKTINGGVTWNSQTSGTTQELYSVYFKDKDIGFITGYDWNVGSTMLLKTTNGGINWNINYIGGAMYPLKLIFINADTGFIAAGNGAIIKTTDGGNNWTSSFHNGNTYFDIFFTDENTGYVVGENGEISKTEDCGSNWFLLNSGTNEGLRSVWFTDINTGYVVGSFGTILKTTNGGCSLTTLNQTNYTVCYSDSILIKPNIFGGAKPLSYQWNNSLQTSSITVNPSSNTTYAVTITDSQYNSCTVAIPVQVTPIPPAPVISINGDTLFSDVLYGNQWYRNDTLINGAYYNTYIAVIPGNYYSVVSNYYCSSDKSNIIQFVSGIAEFSNQNIFIIYPNPAIHDLSIESSQGAVIKITNIQGQTLIQRQLQQGKTDIDISRLAKGLYILRFNSKVMTEVTKFVKE